MWDAKRIAGHSAIRIQVHHSEGHEESPLFPASAKELDFFKTVYSCLWIYSASLYERTDLSS